MGDVVEDVVDDVLADALLPHAPQPDHRRAARELGRVLAVVALELVRLDLDRQLGDLLERAHGSKAIDTTRNDLAARATADMLRPQPVAGELQEGEQVAELDANAGAGLKALGHELHPEEVTGGLAHGGSDGPGLQPAVRARHRDGDAASGRLRDHIRGHAPTRATATSGRRSSTRSRPPTSC